MYEDLKEYLNWYDTRRDVKFAKDAPIIGLVLQRSHLVTGDEGHYSGVVAGLESRGAKVGCVTVLVSVELIRGCSPSGVLSHDTLFKIILDLYPTHPIPSGNDLLPLRIGRDPTIWNSPLMQTKISMISPTQPTLATPRPLPG